jgi:hypothetical protein
MCFVENSIARIIFWLGIASGRGCCRHWKVLKEVDLA